MFTFYTLRNRKKMILFFQFILFAFGTPTQPVNWPTDIFKQKYYSYHGLATGMTFYWSLAPSSGKHESRRNIFR